MTGFDGAIIAVGDRVVVAMRHSSSIWLQEYTCYGYKDGSPVLMDAKGKKHVYGGADRAIVSMHA